MTDEPVVVVDIGSSSVKAGYAGDDVPTSIFPSATVKWSTGTDSIEVDMSISNDDLSRPVRRGVVKDWDQLEKLWRTTLDEIGLASPESASVMLVESPHSTFEDRKRWAELLIDTFRHPSILIGNSAPLSLFASGRTTGIVVECGAGITSTVPVFEGLALTHAAITTDYGGQDITHNLKRLLNEYSHITMEHADVRALKERMVFVNCKEPSAKKEHLVESLCTFGLPDGTDVTVQNDVFSDSVEPLCVGRGPTNEPDIGLIDQLYDSLRFCDDSVRSNLTYNIVLSGGCSMIPGLGDRIGRDLKRRQSEAEGRGLGSSLADIPVRVIPDSYYREPGYTIQRKIAPWIGGSIISSLSTYKQLKITRQEWEESKEACIQTKCI
eukprot:CAMPEP_0182425952 /NCGR_PEP_ID=MMETSP1167-20130531/12437_1 /TAXON_ID=2988 /ORGANISM="Mallomonas Sp, Strain CCMP3275" /LENGTH=380 /DNA_ID=CAMNT_0024607055 /DNA_START=166 /DNA_END=1308 /DNA_ORIENTATION=+